MIVSSESGNISYHASTLSNYNNKYFQTSDDCSMLSKFSTLIVNLYIIIVTIIIFTLFWQAWGIPLFFLNLDPMEFEHALFSGDIPRFCSRYIMHTQKPAYGSAILVAPITHSMLWWPSGADLPGTLTIILSQVSMQMLFSEQN